MSSSRQPAAPEDQGFVVSLGRTNKVVVYATPKTAFTLAPLDGRTQSALARPSALEISVPIEGEVKNLPDGCGCTIDWIVSTEAGEQRRVSVAGALRVQGTQGRVEVSGATPKVHLLEHGIHGRGKFGFRLTFAYPHSEPVELPPEQWVSFDLPLKVQLDAAGKPDELRLGHRIAFTLTAAPIFRDVQFALQVVEVDQGGDEIYQEGAAFAFEQPISARSPRRVWCVGFVGEKNDEFSIDGEVEGGDSYEFSVRLIWRKAARVITIFEDPGLVGSVKRVSLERFSATRVASAPGRWKLEGKLGNLAPLCRLELELGICMPAEVPMRGYEKHVVRTRTGESGLFSREIDVRPSVPYPMDLQEEDADLVFAILGLVAAGNRNSTVFLDYDEETYASFDGEQLTWDPRTPWIASPEALHGRSRGKKPKRPAWEAAAFQAVSAPPPSEGGDWGELVFDDYLRDILAWEGLYPFMYLDKVGKVTVGIGNLLRNADEAVRLKFKKVGKPADLAKAEDVRKAYAAVESMKPGQPPVVYKQKPSLEIADDEARRLLKERVEQGSEGNPGFFGELRRRFPAYDAFPRAAKRALLDMIYNLGVANFDKFTLLQAAVLQKDWGTAAKQCNVSSSRLERNDWRRRLFQYAEVVEQQGRTP